MASMLNKTPAVQAQVQCGSGVRTDRVSRLLDVAWLLDLTQVLLAVPSLKRSRTLSASHPAVSTARAGE